MFFLKNKKKMSFLQYPYTNGCLALSSSKVLFSTSTNYLVKDFRNAKLYDFPFLFLEKVDKVHVCNHTEIFSDNSRFSIIPEIESILCRKDKSLVEKQIKIEEL